MKKETRENKTTMTAREVAVLIENFQSQFRTFGEELLAVKKKLDILFEELGRQKEEIFIIKADTNVIKTDIKKIEVSLDRLREDVHSIKEDLNKRISRLEEVVK